MKPEPTERETRLPLIASRMANIHLAVVFRDAYHYAEVREGNKRVRQALSRYQKNWIAPIFVHDYALDILAKRVRYGKRKSGDNSTLWKPE